MNLLAIYNAWDGEELMEGSIRCIRDAVDGVLVVYQNTSNFGEVRHDAEADINRLKGLGLVDYSILFTPEIGYNGKVLHQPRKNETAKRQTGINFARENGYSHFLHLDCDEYYDTNEFIKARDYLSYFGIDGGYCHIQAYYKRPTWKFAALENFYVPFIHKITQSTRCGISQRWPYPVLVDPTRNVWPFRNVVKVQPDMCIMHHFSYIRKDIRRKLMNSTARENFKIDEMIRQYENAKPGHIIPHYGMGLVECENRFGIDIEGQRYEQETG